jgi:hypothetical protein
MWKKALLPVLLVLAAIMLLVGIAYWYEQMADEDWPFHSEDHH